MSTPKKSKRHITTARDEAMFAHRSGDWRSGIHNPDIAVRFALLCTEFEHVEENMVAVLAGLLGMAETQSARVIYHTLRNPSIKLDILRTLLERAPLNSTLGPEFDGIMRGYDASRKSRNDIVHGLWWTDSAGHAYAARLSINSHPILDAKEVKVTTFDELIAAQQQFNSELSLLAMQLLARPPR